MRAPREAMHEVELAEDDELASRAPRATGPRVPRPGDIARRLAAAVRATGRGLFRMRRWWPVIPAMVVVAALVVGGSHIVQDRRAAAQERLDAAEDRHESEYVASLAGTPGTVAPVDESVHELWRAEPEESAAGTSWELVGDVLMGTSVDGARVEVVDPATGTSLWTMHMTFGSGCFGAGDEPVAMLVCQIAPSLESLRPSSAVTDESVEFSDKLVSNVLALELRTGEPLGSYEVPMEASVLAFDGGVVTLEPAADGRTLVNRREPTTGEVLWTYELAAPDARAADGSPIEMMEGMSPRAFGGETGDWLAAGIQGGGIVLLAADGRVERELAPRGATFMDLFRVGVTAVDGRVLATQTDEGTQVTTDLVSGTVFPGLSVGQAAVVDDGSLGAVVLSLDADGRLTLTDLTSGAAWSAPGVGAFSGWWYVLDERVLVRGERTIAAYDGASGTEIWRAPLRTWSGLGDQGTFTLPPTDAVPPTDGRSILTVEPGDSLGTRVLVATSVRDGQRSWEVPVADDVIGIKEMGGRLYALLEDGGIAALG